MYPRPHRTHRVFIDTTTLHHDKWQTPNVEDTCLLDDGNPFLDERQSSRSYATTVSMHHYARVTNVAITARCRIPSCTALIQCRQKTCLSQTLSLPTLSQTLFLYFISILSLTLSLKAYFCTLSETLALYFLNPIFILYLKPYLSHSLSNPNFCTLSQTLSLSLKPYFCTLSQTLYLSPSTVVAKDVVMMPLVRWRRRKPRCHGRKGCGDDAVAALTWLRWPFSSVLEMAVSLSVHVMS